MNGDIITLVDSHVHIYDCFDVDGLLSAAYYNFSKVAEHHGARNYNGILLLTETAKDHWFERLVSYTETDTALGNWKFRQYPGDSCTLIAKRSDDVTLHIIAGRQIITSEKIEVLALATQASFDDGQPLSDLLNDISAKNGLAVLPWAVGKWLGARGKLIQSILQNGDYHKVLLGDNSGRPVFWHNPKLLKQARVLGIPILRGTDPLPLPWEIDRVGRFGFILQQPLSAEKPSLDLKQILKQNDVNFEIYGSLERPDRFLRNQIALRLRK